MWNAASTSAFVREFKGLSTKNPYGGCHEGDRFCIAYCYDGPNFVRAVVIISFAIVFYCFLSFCRYKHPADMTDQRDAE